MKLLTNYQTNNEETCLQIDKSLKTGSVNLEISPLTQQIATSLVYQLRLFPNIFKIMIFFIFQPLSKRFETKSINKFH